MHDAHDTASRPGFEPEAFLRTLTTRPGVYRMIGAGGEVIYVGKARNLKKRVASYFRRAHDTKTQALVGQIRDIEITVTHTENEALILENNLIKAHKPRYNILLRDDKSYPYIYLSDHRYPRLSLHRGARAKRGRYFGPFPSAAAARESLHLLQKLFPVRQCEDSYYENRTRPCLQYQIKRCTAPCVGLVSEADYAEAVQHAVLFLEGKGGQVIDALGARMEAAAEALSFERAAELRDQIAALRRVQERQYVSGKGGDVDVVAVARQADVTCVQVFFIRGGRNLGNKTFYPRHAEHTEPAEVLQAFLAQYYLGLEEAAGSPIPAEILLSHPVADEALLEQVLSEQAGRRVALVPRARGERARWVQMAVANADQAVAAQLAGQASVRRRLEALQEALGLDEMPRRLECFDISHTMGEAPVAGCVVFNEQGAVKSEYRRFNIEGVTPGDDYAALEQALRRRYTRLAAGEAPLPDVLIIDGGKGQVGEAVRVLADLQVSGVQVVGIAKGPTRKPGHESLIVAGRDRPLQLAPDSPALHLIQQVDAEAHRFAITGHRQRRAKARTASVLEEIPGLGPKRRRQLLVRFGGLQEVARAGVEDLAGVPGVSKALAQRIYDVFHPSGH
ncbi:excinuclease ABC subunit UvrC [Ectothiorhodospiraceae bacterium 2226]|nr:excinuclease ABC subunit UvrC [Ectothiorhodospiraceae bacterium 2226]